MKVLVTGGAGYIGSHTCKALALAGYEPVVFDSLIRGHAHNVKWGPLIVGDLLDVDALSRAFHQHDVRAVIHFAAFAYVAESVAAPLRYHRNNVTGSINLIRAMVDAGCDRIVFSSSCQVYGEPTANPITENQPKSPVNPYGMSKYYVEKILEDCAEAHGLRSVSLRYFNAAGADPDGDIGEEHDPEPHLIPIVLQTAAGMRERFEVFGTDYPTADGTAVRDYVHVTDLADAHVAALRYLEAGGGTVAMNIGTGHGYSVREVIAAAMDVTGRPLRWTESPRRPGDLPALVAATGQATMLLNWSPRFANLRDIVETAWRWHRRVGETTDRNDSRVSVSSGTSPTSLTD